MGWLGNFAGCAVVNGEIALFENCLIEILYYAECSPNYVLHRGFHGSKLNYD